MLRRTFCLIIPRWKGSQPRMRGFNLLQCGALVTTTDFAQTHNAFIRDDFQDGPQEVAGMDPGVVTELSVERDGDGSCF